jgi:hypothetical protein
VLMPAVKPFGRLEVADERRSRLDGDDHAGVLPDPVDEACEQLSPLGGRGLGLPEACEVGEGKDERSNGEREAPPGEGERPVVACRANDAVVIETRPDER